MEYSNILDYIYHASSQGQIVNNPTHNHIIPMGDFGNGFYLSDDLEKSLAWGAYSCNTVPCLNTYKILPEIEELSGCILNPDNDDDLLFWATSVSYPRVVSNRITDITAQREILRLYNIYTRTRLGIYDWILTSRSDDGTIIFATDFFSGSVTIDAIREVYKHASFGTQLILKTKEAVECLLHIDAQFYNEMQYKREYEEWWNSAKNHYLYDIRHIYTVTEEMEGAMTSNVF